MNYIPPSSPFYSPPDMTLKNQPFQIGEKVRPHVNFKHSYPGITEVEVTSCEKGFCETGWLVTVKEFNNHSFGKQIFDSGWFFKINK